MKVGVQILWNVTPICETSQIYYLMGRSPYERRFGEPFKGPIIPFGLLVERHPITAKDQSRIHQFGKKVLTWIVPRTCIARGGEFGKVTYWSQTLRSWKRWTHQKATQKRLNAKEVIFPKGKRRIYFSNRRWTNQNPWRRSGTENIQLDTGTSDSRRE